MVSEANRKKRYRRALEALRSGVPNREATNILGCNQTEAEDRFESLLSAADGESAAAASGSSMLVSGAFGSGKSHLLTYLEHKALSQGFVCSKVTISKETPLYDLGKVFKSAVDNGHLPDHSGRLIEEIGQILGMRSTLESSRYSQFYQWTNSTTVLNKMFPASLLVHERTHDLELSREIEYFWGGDKIRVAQINNGLREIGQRQNFSFRAPKAAELPQQRLSFFIELIKASGYKGWVVLMDEIELVGSYSPLQRGRSYAELARWMGRTSDAASGLVVVGTITDDYVSAIVDGNNPVGKRDARELEPRLENSRYSDCVANTNIGMKLLSNDCITLMSPTDDEVSSTISTLQSLYTDAYNWEAPKLEVPSGGSEYQRRMRYRIRAAINEWDLLRLYPDSRPETYGDEFRHTYEEDANSEQESEAEDS